MRPVRTVGGLAAVALVMVSAARVRAADAEPSDAEASEAQPSDAAPLPSARFTIGALVGTGYGWPNGLADVNHDIRVSTGAWARLGHVIVEGGVLFPRARVFVSAGPRLQLVTGPTDVYTNYGFVGHARSYALAWFAKVGWLPRSPAARVQPYVALSTGYGDIAHVVSLPIADCGPGRNQTCVDTVPAGPLFVGWSAGVRARLTAHLDAVVAVDNQLGLEADFLGDLVAGRGLEQRTLNFDLNLGIAAAF